MLSHKFVLDAVNYYMYRFVIVLLAMLSKTQHGPGNQQGLGIFFQVAANAQAFVVSINFVPAKLAGLLMSNQRLRLECTPRWFIGPNLVELPVS